MAAVSAPRHTHSVDNVAAQYTNGYLMHGHEDPDEHDSTIHQALLHSDLQKRTIQLQLCGICYSVMLRGQEDIA